MITKALFIAAIALGIAVGAATAGSPEAGADPSYYSVLSCSSCEPFATVGLAYGDQVNQGIEDGLAELPGIPD